MHNFKNFLAKLLLAASLISAAGHAAAGPLFRATIDTSSLGTGPAYLGLYFLGVAGAAPATATVSGLTGAFNGTANLSGSVTGGGADPLVFTNDNGGGDFFQAITLGGMFSFDVSFSMAPGPDGATFGWALFDDVQYLGANGDLGNVFLTPGAPAGSAQFDLVVAPGQVGGVAVIPEPSTMALMLLASLGLLLLARRRAWQ
jgi:hypothetical protein